MFSVIWMFGQQQQVKHRRVGELDESSRIGGNDGIEGRNNRYLSEKEVYGLPDKLIRSNYFATINHNR